MSKGESKQKINWVKWGTIAVIISCILIVVTWLVKPEPIKKCLSDYWLYIIIVLIFISSIFATGCLIAKNRCNSKLQEYKFQNMNKENEFKELKIKLEEALDEINVLKTKPKPHFNRWNEITGIRYGHIDYPPLLYHDDQGSPLGIGITILRMIFQKNGFISDNLLMHWDEIENLLYEKDKDNPDKYRIDIIATPIFETHERSQKIGFTSPIFYSEIGLYYSKNSKVLKTLRPPLDFDNAIATIRGHQNIKCHVIEGELSERMVNKYFKGLSTTPNCFRHKKDNMKIPQLLSSVCRGESDFAFVETFQVDLLTNHKNVLINLLNQKELLYPVTFALRKEDYVFRRFINLKLLELDFYNNDGVLGVVKQELEKDKIFFTNLQSDDEKMEKVRKYFIREYDADKSTMANIIQLESTHKNE